MWKLILQLLAARKGSGLQQNEYFSNPGSAPFSDSTFDANAQMPFKGSNVWDRMIGNDIADQMNARYMLGQLNRESELESRKKQHEIDQQAANEAERTKFENVGKDTWPMMESTFAGASMVPSFERMGRDLTAQYPDIGKQGLATFSKSKADIAGNKAAETSSDNSTIKGLADRPFIEPIAKATGAKAQRDSTLMEQFSQSPDYKRLLETGAARKMVEPISVGAGQTTFDDAMGAKYTGMTPTEKMVQTPYKIGDETFNRIDSIRDYNPGSVNPYNSLGRIDKPDPTPPQGIEPAPAQGEITVPSRNQETTFGGQYNPLLPANEEERLMMEMIQRRIGLQRPGFRTNLPPTAPIYR